MSTTRSEVSGCFLSPALTEDQFVILDCSSKVKFALHIVNLCQHFVHEVLSRPNIKTWFGDRFGHLFFKQDRRQFCRSPKRPAPRNGQHAPRGLHTPPDPVPRTCTRNPGAGADINPQRTIFPSRWSMVSSRHSNRMPLYPKVSSTASSWAGMALIPR